VWAVSAGTKRPACQIVAESGTLRQDPPWPTAYTHRFHIHLGALWRDITAAARVYATEVAESLELQKKFAGCMRRLYTT
jgi:hypothetical protein